MSVRSGVIRETTVERVHYDEGVGTAAISTESMKDFCRRRFPEEFLAISKYIDEHPDTLIMDFEDILRSIEQTHGIRHLLQAATLGGFSSTEHKVFIACLLIIHAMRSHEFMTGMLQQTSAGGIPKWEYFWLLKNAWGRRALECRVRQTELQWARLVASGGFVRPLEPRPQFQSLRKGLAGGA